MGFSSPVICKIRHINTKKERTIHVSELKQQITENTSERLQRIPPRIRKGYYEKSQRIPPRIPKGYYEQIPRIPPRIRKGYYKPTPRILQGNYKGAMKHIKDIRRTLSTQREQPISCKVSIGTDRRKGKNTHQQSAEGRGKTAQSRELYRRSG